jgi:hypothetical protein
LNEYVAQRLGPDAVGEAAAIMRSDEPDLRTFHMVRFFYGAYEALDDTLALLRSVGMIRVQRLGTVDNIREHAYFLLSFGRECAAQMCSEISAVQWYARRADLIARVAGHTAGATLKQRQHEQFDYHETQLGNRIRSIRGLVEQRLRDLGQ